MPRPATNALVGPGARDAAAEDDAVDLTVANFLPSAVGIAVATVAYAAAIWPGPGVPRLLTWCVLPLLSVAVLAALILPHRRLITHWGTRRWVSLLCVGYGTLGASWGLAFWLGDPSRSPEYHALLTLVFATAVCAGGVLSLAGFRRLATATFLPMWGMGVLFLLTHGRPALAATSVALPCALLGFNHLAHLMHLRASHLGHDAAKLAAELRTSEAEVRALVTHTAEAIWHLDGTSGMVLDANPAATALATTLGRADLDGHGRAFLAEAIPEITNLLTSGATHPRREVAARRSDGSKAYLLLSTAWIEGPPRRLAVLAHDVTDRKRLEAKLRHDATHDQLTGLPNRAGALRFLRSHLDAGDRPAVLFIDLDQFKAINDQFGHPAGDAALRTIADRLHAACPQHGIVARVAGDEFLLVLPDVRGEAALRRVVDTLLAAIETPIDVDGESCDLSATIGIAITDPSTPVDEVDLISHADLAMFQGKVDGRRKTVTYDSALHRRVEERLHLEHDLRHALSNRELEAWGQPLVALGTGRLAAVELLARWFRNGQLVMPDDFIPVAEETGMVVDLGRQMLGWAVDLLERWIDTPLRDVKVSVNIAARHLRNGQLIADLERRLLDSPIDRSLLAIELTETQLVEDPKRSIPYLEALPALGCELAIDDFGTGYSSLAALLAFPANVIKIDRTFVAGLLADPRRQAVVSAIVTLGRDFEHLVVAEGIETQEQLELLHSLGVPLGQGFLFSAALPVDDLEAWAYNALGPLGALMRRRP